VICSAEAETLPWMCGRATLAIVVSSEFMIVASMTEIVIGHPVGRVALAVAGPGHRLGARHCSATLGRPDVDLGLGAETGATGAGRGFVEGQAHGQALDDLDPVAGGVLGRQQGEAGAGAGAEAGHVGLQGWS
jgi:hypothetical protein